jgi:spore maturation protein SpmB
MPAPILCPSCGTHNMAQFCSQCGEKRTSVHDFSVGHYAGEVFETLTHFDSKILATVWRLIRRPGLLSTDYFAGRRIRNVSPLRLFLLLSVVYFLSNTVFPYNAFTTPLSVQLQMNDYYPAYAASRVDQMMQEKNLTFAAMEQRYNEETAVLSKTMVFTLIPVFALLFYAFLFRKKSHVAEHLVVATHFWSFALLLIGVFIPGLLWVLVRSGGALGIPAEQLSADSIPTVIIQTVCGTYLYCMFRQFYQVTRWYGAVLAAVIAWSFFHLVWVFRFLLFLVTLRSI